jgi:pimeloyl-ACP methyl ester carboxylesterase
VSGLPFDVYSTTAPHAQGSPVFVLIHGIGASHRYLSRLHAEFSGDATVHSIDLPGFGGVPKPGAPPDITAMAAALAALLDQLGVTGAVVVGHSMGVQWAVELGVIRPDLVAQLVLIGPVTDDTHRSLVYQSLTLARDVLAEPPSVNLTVFGDYLRCGPRWFLKQSRFMIPYPIEERMPRLTMPVLVLRGGNDPIASTGWCRRLVGRASRARLVIVPGHRHVVQFTAPRAVAAAIRHVL